MSSDPALTLIQAPSRPSERARGPEGVWCGVVWEVRHGGRGGGTCTTGCPPVGALTAPRLPSVS